MAGFAASTLRISAIEFTRSRLYANDHIVFLQASLSSWASFDNFIDFNTFAAIF